MVTRGFQYIPGMSEIQQFPRAPFSKLERSCHLTPRTEDHWRQIQCWNGGVLHPLSSGDVKIVPAECHPVAYVPQVSNVERLIRLTTI